MTGSCDTAIDSDVVIIGDGPAGSALAAACSRAGVDALVVGGDDEWTATYGAWADDLAGVELLADHDVLASLHPDIVAWGGERHELGRAYGLIDNVALRSALRRNVSHRVDRVSNVRPGLAAHVIEMESGASLRCRLVVDAAGWPSTFAPRMQGSQPPAWQTAFGVVLSSRPAGDLGAPTLMDFRPDNAGPPRLSRGRGASATTFVYSLPVADGWLVEETVLAARPAIEPVALIPLLAARLGAQPDDMLGRAVRTEYVRIPMGGSVPERDQPVVAFGAAAGYVNPTSGYSIVHSMTVAPRVADAIACALADRPRGMVADTRGVWDAVWPLAERRTRVLHDYGLEMMLRLDADAVRAFFSSFFALPTDTWSAYMRSGTPPMELSAVMAKLFRSASWPTRRRLVAGNPAAFLRLIRPS